MGIRDRGYLKSKFETGDTPTEQDFIDLIDSYISKASGESDIVDNLISTDTNKSLSANQGKILKDDFDSHSHTPSELGQVYNEIPSGAKNGVNKIYTTTSNFITGTTRFYINGVRQTLGVSYTETGVNQITLTTYTPSLSDELIIDYIQD